MFAFGTLVQLTEEQHWCSQFDSSDVDNLRYVTINIVGKLLQYVLVCWELLTCSSSFPSYRMAYWWMNLDCQRSLQHKCSKSTVDIMNYTLQIKLRLLLFLKILENLSFQCNLNITTPQNAIWLAGGGLSLKKAVLLLTFLLMEKLGTASFSGSSRSDRFWFPVSQWTKSYVKNSGGCSLLSSVLTS